MKKCCVCGEEVTQEYPLPFIGSANEEDEEYCCPVCEEMLFNYYIRKDAHAVRKAIEYFSPYSGRVEDERAQEILDYVLSDGGAELFKTCSVCDQETFIGAIRILMPETKSHSEVRICKRCVQAICEHMKKEKNKGI